MEKGVDGLRYFRSNQTPLTAVALGDGLMRLRQDLGNVIELLIGVALDEGLDCGQSSLSGRSRVFQARDGWQELKHVLPPCEIVPSRAGDDGCVGQFGQFGWSSL